MLQEPQELTNEAAFSLIIAALSTKKRGVLTPALEVLQKLIRKEQLLTEQHAKVLANKLRAGSVRRVKLHLSWRSTSREEYVDFEQAAKILGRAVITLRVALRNKSEISYVIDDDIVSLRRLYDA